MYYTLGQRQGLALELPSELAVWAASSVGVMQVLGRLFELAFGSRHDATRLGLFTFSALCASMVLLLTVSATPWVVVAFALLYGLFYGGWVAVLPALVMDYFGGRNVSGIIGILYTSVAFGTLIGPSSAGWLFDVTGSYTVPIAASVLATIASAAIVSILLKTAKARSGVGLVSGP
jgi:MFS family permease